MALVNKKFQELITFSRASSGTYVNSSGYITNNDTVTNYVGRSNEFDNALWAKSNSFIQTNLLLQSQTFSSGSWTKQTGTTVTSVLVVAPDGTLTGQQIDWTTTATGQGILQPAISVLGSTNNTKSIYVRADVAGGTVELADPSNTIGTPAFTLTTSWQRVSLTETQAGGLAGVWLRKTASSPAIIYIWGAQLVQGPVPGDYRATTTAALPVLYPDYNGALRARKLCDIATITGHYTNQGVSLSGVFTFTLYAKAGELTGLFLYFSGPNKGIGFNLITGAILQTLDPDPDSYSAVNVGNGWWRLIITSTSGTIASVQAYLMSGGGLSYTGNGSGVYIADAQLVAGSVVTDYADNTTGAAIYAPRFDYDPVTLAAKGLLVEEQRTNLLLYSDQFDNATWIKASTTVAANTVTAPDGTMAGDTITATSVGANVGYLTQGYTAVASTTYTFSVYVKHGTESAVVLQQICTVGAVISGCTANFNLVAGTTSGLINYGGITGATANILAAGNGWYRCTLIMPVPAGVITGSAVWFFPYAGSDPAGTFAYAWGAQVEVGNSATSYIPTVASQVTRAVDVASVNTLSPWYNSSAWTLYLEYVTKALAPVGGNTRVIELNNGTVNTRALFYATPPASGDGLAFQVRDAGVDQTTPSFAGANVVGAILKEAAAAKANDFAFTVNGASPSVDVSGTLPTFSQFNIASVLSGGANEVLNGWLRRITFYPQRLTNAQLQSITT